MIATRAFLIALLALATTSAPPTAGYLVKSHDSVRAPASLRIPSSFDDATRVTLSRRWDGSPAMGQEWQKAKNRGCTLWAQMHADDAHAGALFSPSRTLAHSDFLQLSDLTNWGYVTKTTRISQPKCDMGNGKDMYGLQAALEAKGISADKKDWKCVKITHGDPGNKVLADIDSQTYTNPRGQTVRVTGALYQFAINAKDGVLVIAKQFSPAFQAQYRRPPVTADHLPDLRSSSDLAWLAWKPFHDKGAKLNHIITWSVTNGGTQRLIAAALEAASPDPVLEADKVLKPYPWVGFTAEQPAGELVLGSPNGIGIGFLLVQHKPELGNKRVKRIEGFLADTAASNLREVSLVWDVEDSPLDLDTPMEG